MYNKLNPIYIKEFNTGRKLYLNELNINLKTDEESMDFFLSKEHQKAYDFGYHNVFIRAFPNFFNYIQKTS